MAGGDIIIRGETAAVEKPGGKTVEISLAKLLELAQPNQIDSCGIRLAPEVRFAYTRRGMTILACEYPPGPYTLSWIADDSPAPFGRNAKYRTVTISLPYVIVLAVFDGTRISDLNECFFRAEPLTEIDEDNQLKYPGLLNCSRFEPPEGHPLAWICTQHLDRRPICKEEDSRKRIALGLATLRRCLFEQSFNMSSDLHEYSSWYSESSGVDERISSVERWHEETKKNRFMGLDVPWLDTNETLKSIVERIFANQGRVGRDVTDARQLSRLIFNNAP
ncbi:MAG: hypothetical protein RIC12_01495 [Pirellulales bacterium]